MLPSRTTCGLLVGHISTSLQKRDIVHGTRRREELWLRIRSLGVSNIMEFVSFSFVFGQVPRVWMDTAIKQGVQGRIRNHRAVLLEVQLHRARA